MSRQATGGLRQAKGGPRLGTIPRAVLRTFRRGSNLVKTTSGLRVLIRRARLAAAVSQRAVRPFQGRPLGRAAFRAQLRKFSANS